MALQKRGAFLTLGMTFLSILILALGSAILKNAEDSEERIYEMGSMDRLFHLERSLQHAYRDLFFGVFGMNMTHNQTQHTLTLSIPAATASTADRAFVEHALAHNVSEELIRTAYPNFNFTSVRTAAEIWYPSTNSTAFFIPQVNVTYVYARIKNPATFNLPPLPSDTNGLIMYVNETSALSASPIERYMLRIYSSQADGNVSWVTHTPGPFNLTIEFYGPNANSSDSKLITFRQPPSIPPLPNIPAQNITINMSTTPWPMITVGTATAGLFKDKGYLFFGPYTYNVTMNLTVVYTAPLASNMTMYSYDVFNISSPDLRIGKSSFYRLL